MTNTPDNGSDPSQSESQKNNNSLSGNANDSQVPASLEDTWLDASDEDDDDDEIHELTFQAASGAHQQQTPGTAKPVPPDPTRDVKFPGPPKELEHRIRFESPANPFLDPGLTDGKRRRDIAITFDDLDALPGPVSLKAAIESGSGISENKAPKVARSTQDDMAALSFDVSPPESIGKKIEVAKKGGETYYCGTDNSTRFNPTRPQMELSTQGTSPGSPTGARPDASQAAAAAAGNSQQGVPTWSDEEASARKLFVSSGAHAAHLGPPPAPPLPPLEKPSPAVEQGRDTGPLIFIDPEMYWQSNPQKVIRHGAYMPYAQSAPVGQPITRASLLDETEEKQMTVDEYAMAMAYDMGQGPKLEEQPAAIKVEAPGGTTNGARSADLSSNTGGAKQANSSDDSQSQNKQDGAHPAHEQSKNQASSRFVREELPESTEGAGSSNQMTIVAFIIICCVAVGAATGNVIHSVLGDNRAPKQEKSTKPVNDTDAKSVAKLPKWLQIFNKGMEYERKGEFDDALRMFSMGLNIEDKQAELWHGRGRVLTKQKQFVRAESDLNKALELAPNHLGVQIDLAALHYYKEDFDEAARVYSVIIEKAPDVADKAVADAHYGRALCRLKLGKGRLAVKDLERALELRPSYAKACQQLAAIYIEQGDHEKAISILSEGIEDDGNCPELYFERGLAKYRCGRKEDALSDYKEAIRLNPGNKNFYNDRGFVLLDLERYDEATRDFRMALEIDPTYELAKENLRVAKNALEKKEPRRSEPQ